MKSDKIESTKIKKGKVRKKVSSFENNQFQNE